LPQVAKGKGSRSSYGNKSNNKEASNRTRPYGQRKFSSQPSWQGEEEEVEGAWQPTADYNRSKLLTD